MADGVKRFDAIVVGSGSGASIVDEALRSGLSVAWVDKSPLGGTCLNVGCIPSKLVIAAADRVMELCEAQRVGVRARIEGTDFGWIMERARRIPAQDRAHMRAGIEGAGKALTFYEAEGHFVDDHTMQVGDERIWGERIYLVAGARPSVPMVPGIEEVDYLDSASVFALRERPDSLLIIGGGYVACEFAHFFEAMGTKVTIVQRNRRLVPDEEPEVSDLLLRKLSDRMAVYTGSEVIAAGRERRGCYVEVRRVSGGETFRLRAERVMIAAGRRPNTDLLRVENAGIAVDERGYIIADEYMQTSVPHIWAAGDVLGKHMYKHVANRQALYAWHNSVAEQKTAMDCRAIPHAVFTWPQIASVGMREQDAAAERDVLVGMARYSDVAKGLALGETDGFAKAIADAETNEILGFHIIGPHAPLLLQEAIDWMALGVRLDSVGTGMHIHPALSELVPATLANLHPHPDDNDPAQHLR